VRWGGAVKRLAVAFMENENGSMFCFVWYIRSNYSQKTGKRRQSLPTATPIDALVHHHSFHISIFTYKLRLISTVFKVKPPVATCCVFITKGPLAAMGSSNGSPDSSSTWCGKE
jgi:hypothetical protein